MICMQEETFEGGQMWEKHGSRVEAVMEGEILPHRRRCFLSVCFRFRLCGKVLQGGPAYVFFSGFA